MNGSTLVLGGTRSGKSALAEDLAARFSGPVTYLATGPTDDPSFAERIASHRARRPDHWSTQEVGSELAPALVGVEGLALVDSLGTWVAAHHDFHIDLPALVAALSQRRHPTILVSDEVGMGVHPATELGGRFRDVLGTTNRAVADVVDHAYLVVAGRVLNLERFPGADRPGAPGPTGGA